MTVEEFRDLALSLPEVEERPCHGTPAFYIKGRLLARIREDNESVALKMEFAERDFRLQDDPGVFFLTDHYRAYRYVLAELPRLTHFAAREILVDAWRSEAPKRLVKAYPDL